MPHFTFKQVSDTFIKYRKELNLVAPTVCGIGEFVTIGNRNTITAVFIKSEFIEEGTDLSAAFGLSHDWEKYMSIIQYNYRLGGFLYSWANY